MCNLYYTKLEQQSKIITKSIIFHLKINCSAELEEIIRKIVLGNTFYETLYIFRIPRNTR